MEFHIDGIEHKTQNSALVPMGGKLPFYIEVQTSKLLNLLLDLTNKMSANEDTRKKARRWLFDKTRPGFYMELNAHLHLAYADQRGGHGSQHWWRLFFDEAYKIKIEWGGLYFRSEAEMKIAQELDSRGVLFFANARGRINDNKPLANSNGSFNGRLEVDFLVFQKGKVLVLEVDGQQHNQKDNAARDYVKDRLLMKEGLATIRFTAKECFNTPNLVVDEFLALF
jgi:hypothetical protein